MKPVPHGEPYAGKLHVRFDEGAGVPHGASRSTLHPNGGVRVVGLPCEDCGGLGVWVLGEEFEWKK